MSETADSDTDDVNPEFAELAELEGIELGDDGRIRAKMARNAKAGRVNRDD